MDHKPANTNAEPANAKESVDGREVTPTRGSYLHENPYRLLSIASAVSPNGLMQRAEQVGDALKDGWPIVKRDDLADVSLDPVLGHDALSQCVDLARRLSTDPMLRTVYRQFWPYEISTANQSLQTIADIEVLTLDNSKSPVFKRTQLEFISNWLRFLTSGESSQFDGALKCVVTLCGDTQHKEYLTDLLIRDGESADSAMKSVVEAQNKLLLFVIAEAAAIAVGDRESADAHGYRSLIKGLSQYGKDKGWVTHVLNEKIIDLGERQSELVDDYMRGLEQNLTNSDVPLSSVANDAARIANAAALGEGARGDPLSDRTWSDAARRSANNIVIALVNKVDSEVAEENEISPDGKTALEHVRLLPISDDLRSQVDKRIEALTTKAELTAPTQSDSTTRGSNTGSHPAAVGAPNPQNNPGRPMPPPGAVDRAVVNAPLSRIKGRLQVLLVVSLVLFAIIMMSIRALSRSPHPTVATTPRKSSGGSSSVGATGSSAASSPDPQSDSPLIEYNWLKADIATRQSALDLEGKSVDQDRRDLDKQYSEYLVEKSKVDAEDKKVSQSDQSSIDAYNKDVDTSNSMLAAYRQAEQSFNTRVDSYNAKNAGLKTEIGRYNEIADQLNAVH